jgi:ParB-like chromosome segregation protein Spo0J
MQPEIQVWNIERFIPYARNPRKNDAAVDKMAAAIAEFGFKIPVLARSSGEVVDGHLRLKAARKIGLSEIPVVLCDEWTPAQVKAFRLLVNRSVTWADWDEELLRLELLDLKAVDFDLGLTGFEASELDSYLESGEVVGGLTDEDAVPERGQAAVTRAGDFWLLGEHRLVCGDASRGTDVARLMTGDSADLVFTDPPYNVDYAIPRSGSRLRVIE